MGLCGIRQGREKKKKMCELQGWEKYTLYFDRQPFIGVRREVAQNSEKKSSWGKMALQQTGCDNTKKLYSIEH